LTTNSVANKKRKACSLPHY